VVPPARVVDGAIARLAEFACDDAALAVVKDRQQYARTMLEMAQMVHNSRGRLMAAEMAKEGNVATRINRILNQANTSKVLERAGWIAAIAVVAPMLLFVAAVRLVPAKTFLSVPRPAAPALQALGNSTVADLTLVAQAAPSASARALPGPAPQAVLNQFGDNAFDRIVAAAGPSRQDALRDTEDLVKKLREQLAKAERDLQELEINQQPRLKLTNSSAQDRRLFDLFLLERRWATARNLAAQGPTATGSQLSANFLPRRSGMISVPLGEGDQHQVTCWITSIDLARKESIVVASNRRISGPRWDVPVSLEPGTYRAYAIITNVADGSSVIPSLDFEVK
jgi:hypothetical protein